MEFWVIQTVKSCLWSFFFEMLFVEIKEVKFEFQIKVYFLHLLLPSYAKNCEMLA